MIEPHTTPAVTTTLSRAVENIAEEIASDLLREPEFRAQLRELLRVAFEQSLKELTEEAP